MVDYWDVIEPYWEAIDIYSGPDRFFETYRPVPIIPRLLFAAHFCQSEVCNGGFKQFFFNSTGVLAPEAAEGFRQIRQFEVAGIVEEAIRMLGRSYPREREDRQERLKEVSKSALDSLDDRFYAALAQENGGFEAAANRFAEGQSTTG